MVLNGRCIGKQSFAVLCALGDKRLEVFQEGCFHFGFILKILNKHALINAQKAQRRIAIVKPAVAGMEIEARISLVAKKRCH